MSTKQKQLTGDQAFDEAVKTKETEQSAVTQHLVKDIQAPAEPVVMSEPDQSVQETETKPAPLSDDDRRAIDRVGRYSEFLDDLERNKELRDHVLAYWDNKTKPAGPPVPASDPLSEYRPEDKAALTKFGQTIKDDVMAAMTEMVTEALHPLRDMWAEQTADKEMRILEKEYPRWRDWASPKEMAELRAKIPGISVLAAFLMTGGKKALAHASKADQQLQRVGDVLARQHPAEATPRRHVKIEKREVSFDEAFDRAYSTLKAAVGEPRR